MADKVFTAALALIKVNGKVVGKIRNLRGSEQYRRVEAVGVGTIFASEAPVVGFSGQCSCDLMEINFKNGGLPDALKRIFQNTRSAVLSGESSMEDNLVLDDNGIQIDLFKKVSDAVDTNGYIKPKLDPYATIRQALIESDGFDVSEGNLVSRSQSFRYLEPITFYN